MLGRVLGMQCRKQHYRTSAIQNFTTEKVNLDPTKRNIKYMKDNIFKVHLFDFYIIGYRQNPAWPNWALLLGASLLCVGTSLLH